MHRAEYSAIRLEQGQTPQVIDVILLKWWAL